MSPEIEERVAELKEEESFCRAQRKPLTDLPMILQRMTENLRPQTAEAMAAWEWENSVLPNLRAARLPARFHYEVMDWKQEKQRATYEICQRLCVRTGAIIALAGERGLGKTTIAAQLLVERARNDALAPWERRPPYRKMTDLIALYKPLYADFGSIETEALMERRDGFCKLHPLVVIDELHECDDQRLKDRILTDILDRRYANRNDTLLITNQTPAEFMGTTNDSILSRLSEHGRIIGCKWKSFRDTSGAAGNGAAQETNVGDLRHLPAAKTQPEKP